VTIEEIFAKLVDLMEGLDAEGRRAAKEGLSEDENALFWLLRKGARLSHYVAQVSYFRAQAVKSFWLSFL